MAAGRGLMMLNPAVVSVAGVGMSGSVIETHTFGLTIVNLVTVSVEVVGVWAELAFAMWPETDDAAVVCVWDSIVKGTMVHGTLCGGVMVAGVAGHVSVVEESTI